MPELAFISLGSNVEPETYLPLAAGRLHAIGKLLAVSMVYQNRAVGPGPAPDFLNAAVLVGTTMQAAEIRRRLRQIETDLGRARTADKYAPRVIDLDLCLLGPEILETPELRLPDPDILTRAHLAVTLAELAPEFMHPITAETLARIADRLRTGADLEPRPDVAGRFPAIP